MKKAKAVLFDFDRTLVDTSKLDGLRKQKKWQEIRKAENLSKCKAYGGISEMLIQLKAAGKKIGIVTNSPKNVCTAILEEVELSEHIDHVTGFHDTVKHKPDPDPVIHALAKLEVEAKDALFVGDRVQDMQAGKSAGCLTAAAWWHSEEIEGFATMEVGPDFILLTVAELSFTKELIMAGVQDKPAKSKDKYSYESMLGSFEDASLDEKDQKEKPALKEKKASPVVAPKIPIFQDPEIDALQEQKKTFLGLTWYLKGYWKGRVKDKPVSIKDSWSSVFDDHVKNVNEEGTPRVLRFISAILVKIVTPYVVVVAVPSSNKDKKDTGVIRLVRMLTGEDKEREGSQILVRTKSIGSARKSKSKTDRPAKEDHDASIDVDDDNLLKGRPVLLLDDVVTSGSIFESCQEKLEKAGARRVDCLAVARTIQNPFYEKPQVCESEKKLRAKLPSILSEIDKKDIFSVGKDKHKKSAAELIAENFRNAEALHPGYVSHFFPPVAAADDDDDGVAHAPPAKAAAAAGPGLKLGSNEEA